MNRLISPQRLARLGFVIALGMIGAGCQSESGNLPPVFGAVFGLEGAESIPFRTGKIADPKVRPQDRIVGDAANAPGQCIYRTPQNRRFRAPCPDGYAIGASN